MYTDGREGRGRVYFTVVGCVCEVRGVATVADAHVTLTKDKSCDKRVTGEGDKLPPPTQLNCRRHVDGVHSSFRLINIIFGPSLENVSSPRVMLVPTPSSLSSSRDCQQSPVTTIRLPKVSCRILSKNPRKVIIFIGLIYKLSRKIDNVVWWTKLMLNAVYGWKRKNMYHHKLRTLI